MIHYRHMSIFEIMALVHRCWQFEMNTFKFVTYSIHCLSQMTDESDSDMLIEFVWICPSINCNSCLGVILHIDPLTPIDQYGYRPVARGKMFEVSIRTCHGYNVILFLRFPFLESHEHFEELADQKRSSRFNDVIYCRWSHNNTNTQTINTSIRSHCELTR